MNQPAHIEARVKFLQQVADDVDALDSLFHVLDKADDLCGAANNVANVATLLTAFIRSKSDLNEHETLIRDTVILIQCLSSLEEEFEYLNSNTGYLKQQRSFEEKGGQQE